MEERTYSLTALWSEGLKKCGRGDYPGPEGGDFRSLQCHPISLERRRSLPTVDLNRASFEKHTIRIRREGEYYLDAIHISKDIYNSVA
jgi:hypothetical protein